MNAELVVEPVFFRFEEGFVEDNVRCIPMIVRFKLDACGIKLKLSEWSKFNFEERNNLSYMPCARAKDILAYAGYLRSIILEKTGHIATELQVETQPAWVVLNSLPIMLTEKLAEFNWHISSTQWESLSNLQRFVLLKLCRPGHENKNFPLAMAEFGLV